MERDVGRMKFTSVGTRPRVYQRLWKTLQRSCQAPVFCPTAAHLTVPPFSSTPSLVQSTGGDLHVTSLLPLPSDGTCHDNRVHTHWERLWLTPWFLPVVHLHSCIFDGFTSEYEADCMEEHVLSFPALDKPGLFCGRTSPLTRCNTNNLIVLGTTKPNTWPGFLQQTDTINSWGMTPCFFIYCLISSDSEARV